MFSQEMRIALAVIAALALSGLFAYWFNENFERIDVEYDAGVSLKARENRFLAAEQFLNEMGIAAESIRGRAKLYDLPSTSDVIIISRLNVPLSVERFETLEKWVEAGGHLILPAETYVNDQNSDSEVRREFGIKLAPTNFGQGSEAPELNKEQDDPPDTEEYTQEQSEDEAFESIKSEVSAERKPTQVTLANQTNIEVSFNPYRQLHDESGTATQNITTEDRVHVLQVEQGQGRITFVSDTGIFMNPVSRGYPTGSISSHDNAYFLWHLVQDRNKAWLLFDAPFPSLLSILWNAVPSLLITLGLLIVFAFWFATNRIGPTRHVTDHSRRNVLEQILMVGQHEWRVDRAAKRLALTRSKIFQRFGSNDGSLSQRQMLPAFAEHCQLPLEQAEYILFSDCETEREYIQITQQLQNVWRQL